MRCLKTLVPVVGFLSLLVQSNAITVNYSIDGSSNDWIGTIDVTDSGISIADYTNINFITADGIGSEPIGFFGTNSQGLRAYYGDDGGYFALQSSTFASAWDNNDTWEDLDGVSFLIDGSDVDTTFADGSPSNSITSSGGTITFGLIPEPSASTALLGLAALTFAFRRRR